MMPMADFTQMYRNGREGKYEKSVITFLIARLEPPNWEIAQMGIAQLGIRSYLKSAILGIAHMGIDP
uniref:Uncharacterized protein n=1 Tax=Romanomermis culicivorax TaxID=13658 RepID=A0A915IHG4_ROMCU